MPWCPRCRQEYESRVSHCFDCDVDLVEELAPPSGSAGGGGPAAAPGDAAGDRKAAAGGRPQDGVAAGDRPEGGADGTEGEAGGGEESGDAERIVAADPDALAFLRQVLAALGAAYDEEQPEAGEGATWLWIRGGGAHAVLRAVDDEAFPIVREETSDGPRFRKHDPSRDPDVFDPPILRLSIGEMRRQGEDAVAQLAAIARTASRARREESLYLLGKLGEWGHDALVAFSIDRAVEGDERRLLAALRSIEEAGIVRRRVAQLEPLLVHPDSHVRRLAAVAAGRLGALSCAPALIALYDDPGAMVREEADDALTRISGEDLGYEADHDTEQTRSCVDLRRRWWESVRETLS